MTRRVKCNHCGIEYENYWIGYCVRCHHAVEILDDGKPTFNQENMGIVDGRRLRTAVPWLKGKPLSEEHKRKMRETFRVKRQLSAEHYRKLRESKIGKPRNEETKRKISASLTGRSNPMKGKHYLHEYRKRIT